jgi:hypothetical protein
MLYSKLRQRQKSTKTGSSGGGECTEPGQKKMSQDELSTRLGLGGRSLGGDEALINAEASASEDLSARDGSVKRTFLSPISKYHQVPHSCGHKGNVKDAVRGGRQVQSVLPEAELQHVLQEIVSEGGSGWIKGTRDMESKVTCRASISRSSVLQTATS